MSASWEERGEQFKAVPRYIQAYSDGYIDALLDVGALDLEDRQASEERDTAREACRRAVGRLIAEAMLHDVPDMLTGDEE